MDRPLLWVALGFAGGIWCAASGVAAVSAALVLGAVGVLALWALRLPQRMHGATCLIFLAAGAFVWGSSHGGPESDTLSAYLREHPQKQVVLEGEVWQAPLFLPDTDYARFVLRVEGVVTPQGLHPLHGQALVRWTDPQGEVHTGERVRVRGEPRLRLGPVNHGVHGYEDYLRGQGIHSEVRLREKAVESLGADRASLWYWGSRLRAWEADVFQRCVPEQVLPFVLTVWLGENGQITVEENQAFIASGTAHILSVSGVHVAILFAALRFLLHGSVGSRRMRTLIAMAAVLVFAVASGARVASLRAALMVEIYLAAELLKRESDGPTSMSIAALVFLLIDADWLFDAGFLLSFSSVASLMLFTPPIEARLASWPRWLRQAVAPTLAVQLLPLPLALHFFHVLPIASPLANLIVIPLLSLVLCLAFGTVTVALVVTPVALLLGHAMAPVVYVIHRVARVVLDTPFTHVNLTSPSTLALCAYYVAVGAFFAWCVHSGRRAWSLGVLAAACVIMVVAWKPAGPGPFVEFLDVGHGDSTLVHAPGGATMLVDGGDASEYTNLGAQVVLPYLYGQGFGRLDVVVVSHADRDHLGGLLEVVRLMPVGQVILGWPSQEPLEREFLALCAARGVPVRRLYRGDSFSLGGAEVQVLHPPREWRPSLSENEHSLVLRVTWPGMGLLLTGDIEKGAESELALMDCSAPVMKVPHHGSDTSSIPAFLKAVQARVAVMSVLPRGTYNTASQAVIARYAEAGTHLYRTDLEGGVRVTVEQGDWVVRSARRERGWRFTSGASP